MSQSLVCAIIHMVISTKNRFPMIVPDLRNLGLLNRVKDRDTLTVRPSFPD